jgi:hypothetical protein
MSVQQFVDRRAHRRRLDVGQTDSHLCELADLELDRFGLGCGSGRDALAVRRLVPPDAPACLKLYRDKSQIRLSPGRHTSRRVLLSYLVTWCG